MHRPLPDSTRQHLDGVRDFYDAAPTALRWGARGYRMLLARYYNLLIPALFSLAMPAILLAVLTPIPWISAPLAFLGSIPLRLGRLLIERVPESSWGLVPGGVVPKGIGLFFLLSIFLAGMTLKSRADEEQADAWKACL